MDDHAHDDPISTTTGSPTSPQTTKGSATLPPGKERISSTTSKPRGNGFVTGGPIAMVGNDAGHAANAVGAHETSRRSPLNIPAGTSSAPKTPPNNRLIKQMPSQSQAPGPSSLTFTSAEKEQSRTPNSITSGDSSSCASTGKTYVLFVSIEGSQIC